MGWFFLALLVPTFCSEAVQADTVSGHIHAGLTACPTGNLVITSNVASRAYYQCTEIISVTMTSGVSYIESHAFWGCSGLKSVAFPDSLLFIERSGFARCVGLISIEFGASLEEIGGSTFYECTGLVTCTFGPNLNLIEDYAFSDCTRLALIELPDAIDTITSWVFSYCSALTAVTFPLELVTIESGAFFGCTILETITLPSTVMKIEDNAFKDTGLTCVSFPASNSVTISGSPFVATATIYVPTSYSSFTMGGLSVTKVDIGQLGWICDFSRPPPTATDMPSRTPAPWATPSQSPAATASAVATATPIQSPAPTETVGGICRDETGDEYTDGMVFDEALGQNSEWKYKLVSNRTAFSVEKGEICPTGQITIVETYTLHSYCNTIPVSFIGNKAFMDCDAITGVEFDGGIISIGESAFMGCSNLAAVNFPATLVEICSHAFAMTAVENITIPSGVNSVSDCAFADCQKLRTVLIANDPDEDL